MRENSNLNKSQSMRQITHDFTHARGKYINRFELVQWGSGK